MTRRRLHLPLLSASISFAFLACGSAEEPAQPSQSGQQESSSRPAAVTDAKASFSSAEAARQEAEQIFATRCTACHGKSGLGDGPASPGLTPPPRNFHDPVWQTSVSDEHLEQIIQYGGAAVGKSPAMPSNPDLMGKPETVAALREHIRNLRDR